MNLIGDTDMLRAMSIRPLTQEDFEEFKAIQTFCFWEDQELMHDRFWKKVLEGLDWSNNLCIVEDDMIVATYVVDDFNGYIRGKLMKLGGVSCVATYPQYRRKGYVGKMLVRSLSDMRERGIYVSALQPFKFGFYRRYGYETCAMNMTLTADPNNIRLPEGFKPLPMKPIPEEESYDTVKKLRDRVGSRYNFIQLGKQATWSRFLFSDRDTLQAVMDGDKIVGYIISRLENKDGKSHLRVMELVAETEKARLTILDYIKKHGDQCPTFTWKPFGDEPITDYFHEQWTNNVHYEQHGAFMFRIVDVAKALENLDYPTEIDDSFTLCINDPNAEWNNSCFTIEINKGKASVTKKTNSTPDMEMNIQEFTQLYVGYRSINQLVSSGRVKVNPAKTEIIDRCFPQKYTRVFLDF
ncbi:MAG: GNAT family N-acetyltransferase [Candidatus Bathyarchaeota archaeon]|nr:GNAT family N-acetyltransferase [Candidatus Bathyarchaeota archaeon]